MIDEKEYEEEGQEERPKVVFRGLEDDTFRGQFENLYQDGANQDLVIAAIEAVYQIEPGDDNYDDIVDKGLKMYKKFYDSKKVVPTINKPPRGGGRRSTRPTRPPVNYTPGREAIPHRKRKKGN